MVTGVTSLIDFPDRSMNTNRIGSAPPIWPACKSVFMCLVMKKLKFMMVESECSILPSAALTVPRGSLTRSGKVPDGSSAAIT